MERSRALLSCPSATAFLIAAACLNLLHRLPALASEEIGDDFKAVRAGAGVCNLRQKRFMLEDDLRVAGQPAAGLVRHLVTLVEGRNSRRSLRRRERRTWPRWLHGERSRADRRWSCSSAKCAHGCEPLHFQRFRQSSRQPGPTTCGRRGTWQSGRSSSSQSRRRT